MQNTGPLSWVRTAVQSVVAVAGLVLVVVYVIALPGVLLRAFLTWPVPTVVPFVVLAYVAVRIQRWLDRW